MPSNLDCLTLSSCLKLASLSLFLGTNRSIHYTVIHYFTKKKVMNNSMENQALSFVDLICETHLGLKRQGPGSAEVTRKALSFIDALPENAHIADLGCGTGAQTMILAQSTSGTVIAMDLLSPFVDVLNNNAEALGLEDRVRGMVGSMDDLPFKEEEFDLIWSEGAIDNLGFEKGLRYWNSYLKPGGYVAVTSPTWLSDEHPKEVEKLWADAGSNGLETIEQQLSVLQSTGYSFVAAFTLPEYCWIENYFEPREEAGKLLLNNYPDNEMVVEFIQSDRREVELYKQYKQHYGYVFFIGRKY